MKLWSLWTEGYVVTGNNNGATFHGSWEGETFEDAVRNFQNSIEDERSRDLVDLERMSWWGCRFFDNERDARLSFG